MTRQRTPRRRGGGTSRSRFDVDRSSRLLVIPLRLRPIGIGLAAFGLALLITGVVAGLFSSQNDPLATGGLARLAPNAEASPLAWYGGALLLGVSLAAAAAAVVDRAASPHWWRWLVLSLAAAGLSLDEVSAFHENLRDAFLPLAAPFVLVVGVLAWPLFRSRPPEERLAWIVGATTYLLGAAVLDVLDRLLIGVRRLTPGRVLMHGLEEGLEMAGAIVVLLAFLAAATRSASSRPA